MSVSETVGLFKQLGLGEYAEAVTDAGMTLTDLRKSTHADLAHVLGMRRADHCQLVLDAVAKDVGSLASGQAKNNPYMQMVDRSSSQGRRASDDKKLEQEGYTVLQSANSPARAEQRQDLTASRNSRGSSTSSLGQSYERPRESVKSRSGRSNSRPPEPLPETQGESSRGSGSPEHSTSIRSRPPAQIPRGESMSSRSGSISFNVGVLKNVPARELIKDGYRHAGWVNKRGEVVKNWKLRWLILKEDYAVYYVTPEGKGPKGSFSLEGYRLELATGVTPFSLRLVPSSGNGRVWVFATQTHKEMCTWIRHFEKALSEANNEFVPSVLDEGASASESESDYDDPYDDALPEMEDEIAAKPRSDSDRMLASRPPVKPPPFTPQYLIPTGLSLSAAPFYKRGIDRSEAEQLVKTEREFIVRQRGPEAPMVITTLWRGLLKHYKIFKMEGHGYSLGGDESLFFDDPMSLLRHFQVNPVPRSDLILGKPVGADRLAFTPEQSSEKQVGPSS